MTAHLSADPADEGLELTWRLNSVPSADDRFMVLDAEGLVAIVTEKSDALLIVAAPKLLSQVRLYRKAVAFYIGVDERNGDDEGANLKRIMLGQIDELLAEAGAR